MIISKLLAVKLNTYNYNRDTVRNLHSDIIELIDPKMIKTTIRHLLFELTYDYVVINFNKSLYICEKLNNDETILAGLLLAA